jgi:predicted nucleotidyltransferase
MTRDQALQIIRAHREELAQDYAVQSLALFGSVARNEAGADSDVDVLVEFSRPVGMFHFLRVQARLQDWLGRKVDLVTRAALKSALRERILKEAVDAG